MSDEKMKEITKRNKAKQEELAKSYAPPILLACATPGCKNTIPFKNESEKQAALKKGRCYCAECFEKRLGT